MQETRKNNEETDFLTSGSKGFVQWLVMRCKVSDISLHFKMKIRCISNFIDVSATENLLPPSGTWKEIAQDRSTSGSLSEVPCTSGIYVLFLWHRPCESLVLGTLEGRGGFTTAGFLFSSSHMKVSHSSFIWDELADKIKTEYKYLRCKAPI